MVHNFASERIQNHFSKFDDGFSVILNVYNFDYVLLIFIILFLFINVAQADNHDTATTEEEIREARTLVTATEKVSISSEIAARVEKINFLI